MSVRKTEEIKRTLLVIGECSYMAIAFHTSDYDIHLITGKGHKAMSVKFYIRTMMQSKATDVKICSKYICTSKRVYPTEGANYTNWGDLEDSILSLPEKEQQ